MIVVREADKARAMDEVKRLLRIKDAEHEAYDRGERTAAQVRRFLDRHLPRERAAEGRAHRLGVM
jgi:hypothetical protein